MSDVTSDKVATLLTMVGWYHRLWNRAKAERIFAGAVRVVEDEGASSPDLNRLLDDYAATFRRRGLHPQADRLAALATGLRRARPESYDALGTDIPWWRRADFVRSLPELPLELTPAGPGPVADSVVGLVGTLAFCVAGVLLVTVFQPLVDAFGLLAFLGLFPVALGIGIAVDRWRRRLVARRHEETWCRLDEDGIELGTIGTDLSFPWRAVDRVWSGWVDEDDVPFISLIIFRGGQRMTLSADSFTEEQVRLVEAIARLRTGITEGSHGR